MKKFTSILLACSLVLVSACATQTFDFSGSSRSSDQVTKSSTHQFFVRGVAQEKDIKTKDICKGANVTRIETERSALNVVLGVITLGLYWPVSYKVYCG